MLSATTHYSEAVAQALNSDWFVASPEQCHGHRTEISVARSNNAGAIPAEAKAELQTSPICQPQANSQYWKSEGRGPEMLGGWQSHIYSLKTNPSVIILCHQVDAP